MRPDIQSPGCIHPAGGNAGQPTFNLNSGMAMNCIQPPPGRNFGQGETQTCLNYKNRAPRLF